MQGLNFILLVVAAMVVLNVLMVALTLGVKFVRLWRKRREKAITGELETALAESLVSNEVHPQLLNPQGRRLDLLAELMVEYLSVLSGEERARLVSVAEKAGLVEKYRRMLTSRNRWRRVRAAENLGYFGGPQDVGALSALLSDRDETLRAVAARALARIGTPEAAATLAQTLNDPSELTRLRMAENLERIGPLAIEPLIRALEKGEPVAKVLAARVLGNIRAAEAGEALARTLREREEVDLRAQATLALGKVGNPDDVPVLIEASSDEAWPVRAQAANALEIIGDVSAIPALQRLAVDREWWVRLNSSRALANMGPKGEKALAEVLEGADRYARDRAVTTLEERGITRRAVGRLADEDERGEAARALIRSMVRAGATRYLTSLANGLPEGPERRTLLEILRETPAAAEGETGDGARGEQGPSGGTSGGPYAEPAPEKTAHGTPQGTPQGTKGGVPQEAPRVGSEPGGTDEL